MIFKNGIDLLDVHENSTDFLSQKHTRPTFTGKRLLHADIVFSNYEAPLSVPMSLLCCM